MEVISVNYMLLKDQLRFLALRCMDIEQNMKDVAEATENMDIFWNGDANATFVMGINEDIASIEALILKIRGAVKLLNEALKEYQETEKVIEQIIGGL